MCSTYSLFYLDNSRYDPQTKPERSVLRLEAGSWNKYSFTVPTDFPDRGYTFTTLEKELIYVVGGEKDEGPGTIDVLSVFKSVDGKKWDKKLNFELKKGRANPYACITKNDQTLRNNLVVFGGVGSSDKELEIYDLEESRLARVNSGLTGLPFNHLNPSNKLVCHDGWMHVIDDSLTVSVVLSYKLSNAAYKQHTLAPIKGATKDYSGGQLIVYENKVGIVGGLDHNGNNLKEIYNFDAAKGVWSVGAEFPWSEEYYKGRFVPVVHE